MFTEIVQKVRNDHLARDAFLYVRIPGMVIRRSRRS